MNNLSKAALAVAIQLCCVTTNAQLDTLLNKRLPRITGWADNDHYIVEKGSREKRNLAYVSVDINNGKEAAYTPAKATIDTEVKVIKGDIYLITAGTRKQLTNTDAVENTPRLSPDKKWVAFTRKNDLYTLELASGKETRYTSDGSDVIKNGYASWVYYEEILRRNSEYCAFWWSPNSRYISFFRFDESGVPVYPLYNGTGQHGSVELTRYPKVGDPNPEVQIGIVPVTGGNVVWANFNEKADQYFGTPIWRPDASGLLAQWMPREQNNLKLYNIDPATGARTEIYNEEQSTWINWIDRFKWVKDGFLMVRDFDGWEQIYYHALDGMLKKKLTTGSNWRTEIVKVDERNQTVYYEANGEVSTRTDLYSVRMNGKEQKRLTFGEYTHSGFVISPDGRHIITNYSNTHTPTCIALVDTHNGKSKMLANSRGPKFDSAEYNFREIVWLKTTDGFNLPGRVSWPLHMEKGKKYPVIIRIYGGPNAGSVSENWVNSFSDEKPEPVIRIAIEHRGSGHCGKKGLNYLHRNLGKWEMEDYIAWVKWLRQQPGVDSNKIMICGGSYGGYLTALALTYGAEYFQFGRADYPVTDWTLYDSHYTERYMDLPANNADGYKFASVLTHAAKYQTFGKSVLLIQHGSMDNNVHMQNTTQLVDLFQRLNKSFELMIYPGERHGWLGPKIPFTNSMSKRFEDKYLFGNSNN